MEKLNTRPNLWNADEFYARLMAVHGGLSKAESDALNARLILLLANHIGEADVLNSALETAAKTTREHTA